VVAAGRGDGRDDTFSALIGAGCEFATGEIEAAAGSTVWAGDAGTTAGVIRVSPR